MRLIQGAYTCINAQYAVECESEGLEGDLMPDSTGYLCFYYVG